MRSLERRRRDAASATSLDPIWYLPIRVNYSLSISLVCARGGAAAAAAISTKKNGYRNECEFSENREVGEALERIQPSNFMRTNMAVIKRGVGVSPTEKNLAALADKIFLNLWTYPNLYGSAGKELCDLLVVCGDDVLIFSDKAISLVIGADVKVAWPRWYRKAIGELAAQINGAVRTLRDHPDQLFLDAACKERFPHTLPPAERRRVHLIAVALGASEACAEYRKEPPGYFSSTPRSRATTIINSGARWLKTVCHRRRAARWRLYPRL